LSLPASALWFVTPAQCRDAGRSFPRPSEEVRISWRAIVPIALTVALALTPAPPGLAQHAWFYFAIFAGVIAALMLEPLPGSAVGMIGVVAVTVLAPFVLFGPDETARPGFNAPNRALAWALSGFSNGTVWLIFAAFMFALGYAKSGLGKRIALTLVKAMGHNTLTLGYAIVAVDTLLAPVTPSNTARSGGTIYPILRNVPALYGSHPNDSSARLIGSYIMWVAVAAVTVTSSLFLTAFAPNLLAIELVRRTSHINIGWFAWFEGFAPVGIPLLIAVPVLAYWFYPPEIRWSKDVARWAASELAVMGKMSPHEMVVATLVIVALVLWIFGASRIDPTTVALVAVVLMLLTKVFSWEDVLDYPAAWNTLIWLATLVTLADGLNSVGFVGWFAQSVAGSLGGLSPRTAMVVLVTVFFFSHYMFASGTAHATAMLPVMLGVGAAIPAMPMPQYALLLCLTLGIMGVISPYGTAPNLIYCASGYLPARDFWRLGAIFGTVYFAAFMAVCVPWVLMIKA
jgi:L-tartrate/succinate antiporter